LLLDCGQNNSKVEKRETVLEIAHDIYKRENYSTLLLHQNFVFHKFVKWFQDDDAKTLGQTKLRAGVNGMFWKLSMAP